MQSNAEFLTVDEAAQLTGFSHWSIRRWLGAFPPKLTRYKIGSRIVVSRSELLALLEPKKVSKNNED